MLIVSLVFALIAFSLHFGFLWAATFSPWLLLGLVLFFSYISNNKHAFYFIIPLKWLGNNSLECYYGAKGNSYLLNGLYTQPIIGSLAFILYVTIGTLFLSLVNRLFRKHL